MRCFRAPPTPARGARSTSGKPSGRTQEIQRLIGRSLRAVTNLQAMGERQITIDCDVIQADGGTRTASITGAWIALHDCLDWMRSRSIVKDNPLRDHVAAISCGIWQGTPVLDLDYAEDSEAQTDANFVMAGSGALVEVQASAEGAVFSEAELAAMMGLAKAGDRRARRAAEAGVSLSQFGFADLSTEFKSESLRRRGARVCVVVNAVLCGISAGYIAPDSQPRSRIFMYIETIAGDLH